jgi:hypothetical protein
VTGRRGAFTEVARLAGGGASPAARCFGTGVAGRARPPCRPRSWWPSGRSTAGLRSRGAQAHQATGVYRPARGADVWTKDAPCVRRRHGHRLQASPEGTAEPSRAPASAGVRRLSLHFGAGSANEGSAEVTPDRRGRNRPS